VVNSHGRRVIAVSLFFGNTAAADESGRGHWAQLRQASDHHPVTAVLQRQDHLGQALELLPEPIAQLRPVDLFEGHLTDRAEVSSTAARFSAHHLADHRLRPGLLRAQSATSTDQGSLRATR
jgi:hypothetical protein